MMQPRQMGGYMGMMGGGYGGMTERMGGYAGMMQRQQPYNYGYQTFGSAPTNYKPSAMPTQSTSVPATSAPATVATSAPATVATSPAPATVATSPGNAMI